MGDMFRSYTIKKKPFQYRKCEHIYVPPWHRRACRGAFAPAIFWRETFGSLRGTDHEYTQHQMVGRRSAYNETKGPGTKECIQSSCFQ
jgi:hypothetical protein